jgi:hypothetical protein
MNKRRTQSTITIAIKPFYSIRDLTGFLGYKTTDGCRRFLYRLGLPISLVGGKLIVYLVDLQTYTPNLWNSILECNNLRSIQQQQIDDDNVISGQFFDVK